MAKAPALPMTVTIFHRQEYSPNKPEKLNILMYSCRSPELRKIPFSSGYLKGNLSNHIGRPARGQLVRMFVCSYVRLFGCSQSVNNFSKCISSHNTWSIDFIFDQRLPQNSLFMKIAKFVHMFIFRFFMNFQRFLDI